MLLSVMMMSKGGQSVATLRTLLHHPKQSSIFAMRPRGQKRWRGQLPIQRRRSGYSRDDPSNGDLHGKGHTDEPKDGGAAVDAFGEKCERSPMALLYPF